MLGTPIPYRCALDGDGLTLTTDLLEARWPRLDRLLLRRLEAGPRPAPEVDRAWKPLVATGGAVPIAQLAGEVGWSHTHLIAKFRQQVGLRPKTAAQLIRFNGVWRHLDGRRPLDWARVAREAGYADQAHLIREFHQFTGTTPTAYAARGTPGRSGRPAAGQFRSRHRRRRFLAWPEATCDLEGGRS